MRFIVQEYAGARLTIPAHPDVGYKALVRTARRAATSGISAAAAAQSVGMTQRTIYNHRKRAKKAAKAKGSLL